MRDCPSPYRRKRSTKMARTGILVILLLLPLLGHVGAQSESAVEKFTTEACQVATLTSQKLSCGSTVPSDETDVYLSSDTVDRMVWQRIWAALESDNFSDLDEADLSTITPINSCCETDILQSRRHLMAYLPDGSIPPIDAQEAREAARNNADTPGIGANEFTVTTQGRVATYTVDPAQGHRVVRAQSRVVKANGGAVGARANEAVDMLWNPDPQLVGGVSYFYREGAARSRDRREWNAGHIIGSALGGSDSDPLNFVPQHHSNNQGGRWRKAEEIAAGLITTVRKRQYNLQDPNLLLDACPLAMREVISIIQFDYLYPVGANSEFLYVPSGGTYTIRFRMECTLRLTHQALPLHSPARRWADNCVDTLVGGLHYCDWVIPWSNGPGNGIFGDNAIRALPAGVAQDPRANVAAELLA